MQSKLGKIAEIQFGLYEKGKATGQVKYLQASHFNEDFQLSKFESSYIELDEKSNRFLLQPNDVILAGKGQRLFAWAYDPAIGSAVPSSLFYLIRSDANKLIGKYLAYCLNSMHIQHQLKLISAGASISSVPKRELQQIPIRIPTIESQMKIVEIANVMEKDIALTEDLLYEKKMLKRGLINKMITNQLEIL